MGADQKRNARHKQDVTHGQQGSIKEHDDSENEEKNPSRHKAYTDFYCKRGLITHSADP